MNTYDVAVIGGGAAGLSAALVLTRARRSVVVIDAGEPRNAPAAHMQGFLSRDGMAPAELLAVGRGEVAAYGGHLVDGTVTSIRAAEPGGFEVRCGDGSVAHRPSCPGDHRAARRGARPPGRPRALGSRPAALPVLPRARGPRPAPRCARRDPGGRPARPDRPAVVRRRRLLRPHRDPDPARARAAAGPGHRRRRGPVARLVGRGRPARGRRARRRPDRAPRRRLRPPGVRAQRRPARRARLRTAATTAGSSPTRPAAPASPASGWPATPSTLGPR